MSEQAALLDVPVPFEFEGQTYQILPRNFEVEALYTVWLQEQALVAVRRHQRSMTPWEYSQHMDGWRRDCGAGVYDFEGMVSLQSQVSPPGMKQLAFLTLKRANPMLTMDVIDRLWQDQAKWQELSAKISEVSDPNRKRPEASQTPAKTA